MQVRNKKQKSSRRPTCKLKQPKPGRVDNRRPDLCPQLQGKTGVPTQCHCQDTRTNSLLLFFSCPRLLMTLQNSLLEAIPIYKLYVLFVLELKKDFAALLIHSFRCLLKISKLSFNYFLKTASLCSLLPLNCTHLRISLW